MYWIHLIIMGLSYVLSTMGLSYATGFPNVMRLSYVQGSLFYYGTYLHLQTYFAFGQRDKLFLSEFELHMHSSDLAALCICWSITMLSAN